MIITFDYFNSDEIGFEQMTFSKSTTHLSIESKDQSHRVEIYMSVDDAQGFINRFQNELNAYKNYIKYDKNNNK
jgi:hypothetical protein